MYTSPKDYADLRACWYRTQKQREAVYAVSICLGLFVAILGILAVVAWIRGA